MTKHMRAALLAAAIGLAVPAAASAHHSFAMFDREKEIVLSGQVRSFGWTNPHAWIELDVVDAKGVAQKWDVEMNSPNNLARQGWKKSIIQPGDKVQVTINPLRSGKPGGLFVAIKLPDGKVLGDPTRNPL